MKNRSAIKGVIVDASLLADLSRERRVGGT
jgi:hypothetical protein